MIYIALLNTSISPDYSGEKVFLETHSFRKYFGELLKTLQKLCLSKKFPYQEISSNFCILRNA